MTDRATGTPFRDESEELDPLQWCRTLAETIDGGVCQLDADWRFVGVDDRIVELSGYDRESLLGEHVSIVVTDADGDRLERELLSRTGSDDGGTTGFDLVIEAADGDRLPCELRFTPLVTDGELAGVVGVVRELDDRPTSHDEPDSIWETYDSIATVIDEADVGVFVLDEGFDVVWINETIETYFEISRADVIGRDKQTLIEKTIRDKFADPDSFAETVLATYDDNTYVEQFECRIEPSDSRPERWLEHRSRPIESGRYVGGRIELYYDITERKAAERARRESERRFQSLVDAIDEYAISMLDPEGRVVSWNEGGERIKGYDRDRILGEHFSMFHTESDRSESVPERTLARARDEGTAEREGWLVHADGSTFWASITVTAIRNEGNLQGYAMIARDMTERRERERQLQRERDLVERILETSPVGIAVVEPDGSIGRANERMVELLGGLSGDVEAYTTGKRDVFDADGDRIPRDDRSPKRAFDTGAPVYDREIRVGSSDRETWLSINAAPIVDAGSGPERVVTIATDITDLKELSQRRKRELEEREKELSAVRLATSLLETGDRPIEELVDAVASKLPQSFRYPDHTAARVAVGDHEASTDGYRRTDRSITARSETANGTPITIDVSFVDPPVEGETGAFLEEERELIDTLVTLVKFHFERQEYIDQLQAETRRLEQFAYAASHDLQEPLRMVSSYLQLLERRYGDEFDEDGEAFLEFAVDGATRMREMIDGLLTYSRVQTQGEPFEPVDLDAVLADVRADLEVRIAERNAEITAESLPRVTGDPIQLRQVLQNLLDNAIEYGGDDPQIHVSADRRGDEWVVSVRDEGIGIESENRAEIFDVFERLHSREEHPGTGIGLAICERIVERHGGEIWVDSKPGEGSEFFLTLPAADESGE
ncbi:PAS domain S-box protein [Natrarchaeobius chitinivorans]|uniref:histidine kinase n=1 Tax=Natrarchaeobius chitinivorans TaxID=1679083 RepID=A0A3N6MDC4_NATCH|nr:PAS domain S-box protein [Natrarchaeobius chitinivorans]RQG91796.1 PAS domain S-box protein [Natrarchaeobius chitinivorans]